AIPEDLLFYFDYEAFARDLFINDYFSVEADGQTHVFSSY
ncbi:antirestriction protein ArdA, partial [Legionella pneumophila]